MASSTERLGQSDGDMYERQGKSWQPEEDQQLTDAFRAGAKIMELCAQHQRRRGAIRSRLLRLGLIDRRSRSSQSVPPVSRDKHSESGDNIESVGRPSTRSASDRAPPVNKRAVLRSRSPRPRPDSTLHLARIAQSIDHLIAALQDLQTRIAVGKLPDPKLRAIALAYEQLDGDVMDAVPDEPGDSIGNADMDNDDPLPDRLRTAVLRVIRACVSKTKDRYIAIRVLGLTGDGIPATLAAVGEELSLSRERIRQRRNRAFRSITATMQRRVASSARLRAALLSALGVNKLTDAGKIAELIVNCMTDRCAAARQLTLICCKAAGLSDSDLTATVPAATLMACRDVAIAGKWRVNHWRDIAPQVIGSTNRFKSPPDIAIGSKRMPHAGEDGELITLHSEKLGRNVACESGTELRVFTWLEHSTDIRWYQEQPVSIPYVHHGRPRRYYPDVAIWDQEGRVAMIEVKPVFTIYREETVIKAIAALDFLVPQGIGYLLVDASGRTPATVAHHAYDEGAAQEIESLFAHGSMPFRTIREIWSRRHPGRTLDVLTFASMVVNRDWSVTDARGVRVGKLPEGVSFRPLIRAETTTREDIVQTVSDDASAET
jgi:hypothetical protein